MFSLQADPVNRLPFDYAAVIVLAFVALGVVHWVRRANREPVKGIEQPVSAEEAGSMVTAFDIVERLYHWALFVVTGLLVLTGVALFVPGYFNSFVAAFGVTNGVGLLLWHDDMVWALLGLLVIHIVWDLAVKRGWKNIWLGMKDIRDIGIRTKNFFGLSPKYSKPGKYDIFMKTLHWGMTVSLIILGITGLFFMNPYGLLPTLSPSIDSLFRILHDIFAFLFIGLVIGHIYFAMIPVNWPVLRAIFTGNISKEAYNKEYDSERWSFAKGKPAKEAPAQPQQPKVPVAKATDVDSEVHLDTLTKKLVGE
jgi:formate dehydrogenase subunit gamma